MNTQYLVNFYTKWIYSYHSEEHLMSTSLLFFSSLISERQNRPRLYNLYFTLSKVMSFFPVQLYAFSLLSAFSIRQIFLLALDISIFFSF